MHRIAACALILLLTAAGAPVRSFDLHGWSGAPVADDRREPACRMTRTNERGATLTVVLDGEGNAGVGLGGEVTGLDTALSPRLHYRINNDALLGGPIVSGPDNSIMAWFSGPDYSRILVPFAQEGQARFHVGQRRIVFDLPGAARALTALIDCVQDGLDIRNENRGLSFPILMR